MLWHNFLPARTNQLVTMGVFWTLIFLCTHRASPRYFLHSSTSWSVPEPVKVFFFSRWWFQLIASQSVCWLSVLHHNFICPQRVKVRQDWHIEPNRMIRFLITFIEWVFILISSYFFSARRKVLTYRLPTSIQYILMNVKHRWNLSAHRPMRYGIRKWSEILFWCLDL